jgi:LmbE family N-acetylglucosaminyl deacetylase
MDTSGGQAVSEQRIEVLSPHFDDAVYSCWHALNNAARVVTVFGGFPEDEAPSAWDLSTGFSSSREAIEARTAENTAALLPTNANACNLPFLDTVFRRPDELQAEDIHERLTDVLDPHAVIYAPVGFSFTFKHADHILLREVGKRFAAQGREVCYYADIPYCLDPDMLTRWPEHLPMTNIHALLGREVHVVPVELTPEAQAQKYDAVRTYASQFDRNNALSGHVFDKPAMYEWEAIITE